jgi:hypothetical protein
MKSLSCLDLVSFSLASFPALVVRRFAQCIGIVDQRDRQRESYGTMPAGSAPLSIGPDERPLPLNLRTIEL